MIKYYILVVITLLFGIISYDINAQEYFCPEPYGNIVEIDADYIYGANMVCHIHIVYCCWWDNTNKTMWKTILSYESIGYAGTTGSNCLAAILDWDNFLQWLNLTVATHANLNCQPDAPPCDEQTEPNYTKVVQSACVYAQNVLLYSGDDVYSLKFKPCTNGTANCTSEYIICYDYNYSPPILRTIFVRRYLTGTVNCNPNHPQMPPIGKTWSEPWTTECYMNSSCN